MLIYFIIAWLGFLTYSFKSNVDISNVLIEGVADKLIQLTDILHRKLISLELAIEVNSKQIYDIESRLQKIERERIY